MKRLIKATFYSIDGIKRAFQDEAAFREEAFASILLIPIALWFGDGAFEKALLIAAWLLVPMVELLNTGIETIVDYATKTERHDLAKKAKDTGSAAVLFALIIFALVWLGVFMG
jgi:diacylglycerol kinase (ATP)